MARQASWWVGGCACAVALGGACGGTSASPNDAGTAPHDASADHAATRSDAHQDAGATEDAASHDASDSADAGCHAGLGAADRARKIVVSHPFDNGTNPSGDFEVFDVDTSGAITEPNVHFKLGPTTDGTIAFTPDGLVGLVAEDDGTLGVFRFDATGTPHVVSVALKGSYYATSVVMDPSGARAYVLDDQTANNGGGIYAVSIACDGTITDDGLRVSADLPATVIPLANGQAVILAKQVNGAPALVDGGVVDGSTDGAPTVLHDGGPLPGNDAVLVTWPDAGGVLGHADPFGDELAIVSRGALTQDGKYILLGDNSQFSGVPNRVGIVGVGAGALTVSPFVDNVNDPESVIASPFDDTVFVTSAFGNAFFVIDHNVEAGAPPFVLGAPVTYMGAAPQLPGPAVMLTRGSLIGRIFVGENQAIRQVQFGKTGGVTDLGGTSTGDSNNLDTLVGAIGIQP